MQQIIWGVLTLFLSAAAAAEVIESVSFNPSRFGQYERLTVSERADLKGGLSTTNLNVSSAGQVGISVQNPLDNGTAFYIPTVDAVQGNGVSLTNACFSGSGADCKNYSASSATLPNTSSEPLTVSSRSGTGTFERDSFFNRVTTLADSLRIKAGQINLHKLTVQGGGGRTYSGASLKGVKLAGNDIPPPTAGNTKEKDGVTSKTLTNCELAWEERKTVQVDGKYDTYKVLVLKNCGSSGGESGDNGYCCSYTIQSFDQVTHENDWDNIRNNHLALVEHESCSNFNPTQGTAYNCADNADRNCYEGFDYDCPEYSGSLCPANVSGVRDFNVYWHRRKCVQTGRKPCKDVSEGNGWYRC